MIGHIKSGQYKKNIARAILKKYCPPHKARGIHDFILATKSSVWIIIIFIRITKYTQCNRKKKIKNIKLEKNIKYM